MGFYVEQADRSYQSRLAAEDITVGTLVAEDGSDKVELVDDSNTTIDGLAVSPRSAQYIAKEEQSIGDTGSDTAGFTYLASENDRVPYLPLADRDAVKARTITDNGTDPAPSIDDGTVVGVAQKNDDAFRGRLVEEGYTDNAGTTYGRSSTGGFTVLGVAYKDSGSGYDAIVRVDSRSDP